MSRATHVLGHTCDGLARHLDAGGGCVPNINEVGIIRGCDDQNTVRIEFCPYCGVKLDVPVIDASKLREYDTCPYCGIGNMEMDEDGTAIECYKCKYRVTAADGTWKPESTES